MNHSNSPSHDGDEEHKQMYIDTYENQNSMLITKEALTSQEKQNMSQIVTVPDKYAIKKEIRGRQLKNPLSVS